MLRRSVPGGGCGMGEYRPWPLSMQTMPFSSTFCTFKQRGRVLYSYIGTAARLVRTSSHPTIKPARTRQPFLSSPSLRFEYPLPKICLLETPMPFSIRPFRRFPVQCSVTYNAGPFQGQGTVWNLSCAGWRLSGDLPTNNGVASCNHTLVRRPD